MRSTSPTSTFRRIAVLAGAAALALAALPASAHPPRGIVVATDGTVYFSDLVRIHAIAPDGKVRVASANRNGHTHTLALARDGAVWGDLSVYDSRDGGYTEAIWRMRPDGSRSFRYGPHKGITKGVGLLRDARGCTWHADQAGRGGSALVHRKCPGRPVERMFGTADDDRRFSPVLVNDLAGTALASDGGFVFRHRGTVRKIAPDGRISVLAEGLAHDNFGLAIGPGRQVFVAEQGNRRVISIGAGRPWRIVASSGAPWAPTGVAWRGGRLYVLEAHDHAADRPDRLRVRRIDPGGRGAVLATVTIPGS